VKRRLHSLVGLSVLACVFTVLMVNPQAAWSQEVTANITGTVTDPSGAPIVGASAIATDTQRGTNYTGRTNDAGIYNISRIPIGVYTVKVQQKGFDTAAHAPITLDLNTTARLDFQLKVGQVTEVVEVSSAAPLLQTQSTEVSTVIDATTQVSLPLGTRDYLALTLLAPGATTPDATLFSTPGLIASSGRPYINGNREQANAILLDGIDASENNNNEVGYTPSPDAIQEFNLITQNASAEFGSYEGGVISTSIKSGTNNFHGSIFEFYRDGNMNANSWANGLTAGTCGGSLGPCPASEESNGVVRKPGLVWNQFGAAVGGPIIKNKLFFFADYEGQRFDTPPSAANVFVLTNAERAGDFGVLCTGSGGAFVGGVCTGGTGAVQLKNPSTGANVPNNNLAAAGLKENAVTTALLNAIPQGDAAGNLGVLNGNQINNDQGDLKIDYNMSDKDHFFGRWSQAHIRNPFSSTFALSGISPATEPLRNFGAQWVHSINSSLLNELRFGFNAVDFDNPNNVAGSVGKLGEQIGIAGGNANAPGLPSITAGGFNVGSNALFQDFHTTTGQIDDSFSITYGRHQVKLGFQYQRLRLDNTYSGNAGELGSITFGGGQTGSPLGDLWLGDASNANRGAVPPVFGRRANVYGAFVQDDWRVTDTLTLNLGMRFEDHTPFYEIHNREVNFAGGGLVAGGLQIEQNNNTLYNNYLGIGDFLPRIGLSWSPAFLHNKTVVRAGYAVSEYTEGGGVGEQLTINFPFTAASFNGNFSSPNGNFGSVFAGAQVTQPCPNITISCYQGVGSIFMFDPNFRPTLAQQWNLTIQHQINNSTTAQIGYVGQHGTHLYNFMEYNQAPLLDSAGKVITQPGVLGTAGKPVYLSGDPTLLSEISFARGNASNGSQRYDALQAVLQHRMSNGLDAQVAYTYSKCLSDSGGFYGTWGSGAQTSHGQVGWTSIFNPRLDWGPCFFDQTHLLSSYVTYQLPVGRGKKFGNHVSRGLDALIGGWEVGSIMTFHSGNAMSDFVGWGGDSVAGVTGGASQLFGGDRSNCSGPVQYPKKFVPAKVTVSGGVTSVTPAYMQWFDTSTFSPLNVTTDAKGNITQSSYGTCGQGNIRGPRFADVDMSLHKEISISESKRFEFRAEAYNALNHPILSRPDYNFGDTGPGGFGAITGSQGGRQFQLGLKFYF
jgi:hypothetical protein